MSTVVPTGGKVTSALLLGWALADRLADELEDLAAAVELAPDDAEADVAAPDVAVEAVLWVAVLESLEFVPAAVVELDDPPQPASSNSSEPIPAATVHPLLRITSVS
jgi:hypothetical protein